MKEIPKAVEGTQFLSGWKEVANYLGKGVRTVQRYERELGFPVRRPAGKSHAAVIATKAEVDAWVAAIPIRQEFRLSRAQDAPKVALDDLKKKVATMGALRDEMEALRNDLKASVENLRESIQGIHGGIRNHLPGGGKRTWTFSDADSLSSEYLSGEHDRALSIGNRRKAS